MSEERKEFVLSVANYAVLTGKSTRQLAEVFRLSNVTIHSILTKQLEKLCLEEKNEEYNKLYNEVQDLLDSKKPKSIEDVGVKTRVLKASKLLLEGKLVSEIAEILDRSFYTIYRDLVFRLPMIEDVDKELINDVKEIMKRNKELNLEIGRAMPVDSSKRDEKGKFI